MTNNLHHERAGIQTFFLALFLVIINFNSFGLGDRVCNLYSFGSFFNHDCIPNVYRENSLDVDYQVMFHYTDRDIEKGEELYIDYITGVTDPEERK